MHFLNSIIRRLSITKPAADVDDVRVQQGSIMGKVVDAEIYMPYGSSANIPAGSLCTVLQVGGDEGYLIVLPDRSQDRVKDLAEGEVAYFNPLTQTHSIYRANGDLEQQVNGEKRVTITKDLNIIVEGAADIKVAGNTTLTTAQLDVKSPLSNIGEGGPKIARVGDSVEVTVTGGSSAGTYSGTITSGGVNTSI